MRWVLFFDGDCGFCNKSVQRVYALDTRGLIDFAPLQGDLAAKLGLAKYAEKTGGTMVLIRESDGKRFLKSDAWSELGKAMGGFWKFPAALVGLIPHAIRDRIYDFIATNRYRLAQIGGTCGLPDEGLRKRMRE
jgi:predicted DCC family thiol-disulfide oxidoreductase YuxK